jgi:hypothetical protein
MTSDWYRITVGGLIALGLVGGWLTWRRRKERKACEAFAIRYGKGRFRVTVEEDDDRL